MPVGLFVVTIFGVTVAVKVAVVLDPPDEVSVVVVALACTLCTSVAVPEGNVPSPL